MSDLTGETALEQEIAHVGKFIDLKAESHGSHILSEYRILSRLSLYIVMLAWIILGVYLYVVISRAESTSSIVRYFLSTEDLGVKFRALILLAPFILTVVSYLISDRARLLLKTLLAERELRALCDALIVAFANAIDAKSPWTQGHSERVTSYALLIAEEMGVSEAERRVLRIASLLHDIGKIGTYDVILDKPGPLTDEEWNLIKRHPLQGESILRPIKQLQDVIPIMKHHHERVDGGGYPDGLRGDEIPLLAKILCLADSYDAMIADRPYKKGLDKENAFSEIRKKSGTQFAPEAVKAFFAVIT